jgi:hypothetical protein
MRPVRLRNLLLAAVYCLSGVSAFAITAFFSDCQSNAKVLKQVVSQIVKFKPESVFIAGDITYNGSRQDDFTYFFDAMQPLTEMAEIYPAFGNHDKDTDLFLKNFPQVDSLTYYTVDRDSVFWIILNSNLKLAPGSVQYNWLEQNLKANQNRTLVVIQHHPVFSSGAHGDEKGFSFLFPQLFSQYGVAAVFSGHDHIYERSVKDSVQYVVFGGAGGNLYDQDSKNDYSTIFLKTNGFIIFTPENGRMIVKAYDLEANLIDEFSFTIKSLAAPVKQPTDK